MFTGIVETTGSVIAIDAQPGSTHFIIEAGVCAQDVDIGDSIAINGTCLTVTHIEGSKLSFDAVPNTLACTNLGELNVNDAVNLERAMTASTRIGGHQVQGHVDTTLEILSAEQDGNALNVRFSLPNDLRPFVVHKGFVAVDGMSLTVMKLTETDFSVTLIPHTQQATIAKDYSAGKAVNFEADMTAKYIVKIMENYREQATS